MKFDLSRVRGPATVVFATAIALAGYGFIINAAFGRHDSFITRNDQTSRGPTSINGAGRRLVGISKERGPASARAKEQGELAF